MNFECDETLPPPSSPASVPNNCNFYACIGVAGYLVPVFFSKWIQRNDVYATLSSTSFRYWSSMFGETMREKYKLRTLVFTAVDVNTSTNRLKHTRFHATVVDETGLCLPGNVELRGNMAAVLPVIVCNDKEYVILTSQARVAMPSDDSIEVPTGDFDGEDFVGPAAEELYCNADISIQRSDVTGFLHNNNNNTVRGVFTSTNDSDARIDLYVFRHHVTPRILQDYETNFAKPRLQGVKMSLRIFPLSEALDEPKIVDMKTILMLKMYTENAQSK